jgi:hypothetical protein
MNELIAELIVAAQQFANVDEMEIPWWLGCCHDDIKEVLEKIKEFEE